MRTRIMAALGAALILASCGGDGSGPTAETDSPHAYIATAAPHSYAPPQSRSHAVQYRLPGAEHVTIGGDLEPRENLRHILTQGGIRFYIGAVRDGVGVDRLVDYGEDLTTKNGTVTAALSQDGFYPFASAPVLYLDSDFALAENAAIASALNDAVLLLNDALPPEYQMRLAAAGSTAAGITVSLETSAEIASNCGAGAVACAQNTTLAGYSTRAVLRIPNDFDTSQYTRPRVVIVHELLHALGIQGHVDSVEFPDSIMGTAGEFIPNLGHVISKIDREVLQIMYMSQNTTAYNDWGEWSDVSHHLVGRTEDGALNFGVALFNGLPQPWVRGGLPGSALADSDAITGTATWNGALLGYSGPSPIAGDASLEVDMATISNATNEQDLRFRNIYFVNRFENPDRSATSALWFTARNIDYKVRIVGNGFANVGGDGFVTGAFVGAKHEHMGGTVKRTDMIAAFGGSR